MQTINLENIMNENTAQLIAVLLSDKGFNSSEISKITGVNASTIRSWKKRNTNGSKAEKKLREMIIKITRALDIQKLVLQNETPENVDKSSIDTPKPVLQNETPKLVLQNETPKLVLQNETVTITPSTTKTITNNFEQSNIPTINEFKKLHVNEMQEITGLKTLDKKRQLKKFKEITNKSH